MAGSFEFNIITPNGKKYKSEADLLTVTTCNGVIGVMKGHTPLNAIVEISELIIHNKQEVSFIAIGGGILHISKDEVVILAETFETSSEIDIERANAAKLRAEKRLSNNSNSENIDVKRAEIALKKAINRINTYSK